MDMNILVTGGAGFIGSHFIKYMLTNYDFKIVNIDNLTYAGNIRNLAEFADQNNYHFVRGDINDRELLDSIFMEYDCNVVINFAAESHVDRSIANPALFLHTNVLGTEALLGTAHNHWMQDDGTYREGVKFIQISTDEVYGTLGKEGLFTEETNLAPNSPYAASKASADLMVRAYHETYGLPINITRCSNNYGPYQFPEKLIPVMIQNAIEEKALPVYGDGMQIRDWLHVYDHCKAIDAVLHKAESGEVYNIGGNNEKVNLELVKLILSKVGKSEALITYVADRLGHDKRYAIDSSKIKRNLGWEPTISFEKGIDMTIEWYINNKDWVGNVLQRT